ncbi:MAG: hypothetical protein WCG47_09280 [Dermatophilaceae bacterium]
MTRPARDGVDVPSVFAVIEGVKGQSGMAQFQFRAGNKWIYGTRNHCAIRGFLGRGQEDISRTEPFTFDVAHPAVTIDDSNGPAAVELPLQATAGCLTSGGDASRRNSPHWSNCPGRGRPAMTWWSTAPTPSSTSPRHRWPASASAHRLLNGSTPDPGTPGVYAGPDNQGVYAGPRPLPRAACRRAERARL